MATDLYGQDLPHVALENYRLGTGEVLAMSTHHPRSFDGRYFGPIQTRSDSRGACPRLDVERVERIQRFAGCRSANWNLG